MGAKTELRLSTVSFRDEKFLKWLEPEDEFILTLAAAAAATVGQSRLPRLD